MKLNYKADNIYTICYDDLQVFEDKESAKEFYTECYYMSEGAEQQRYASILIGLNDSNIATDNDSEYCKDIYIHDKKYNETALKVELEESMSIDDTIKYYNEKLIPILKVSEDYDVNFLSSIPFEQFGSDEESDFMSSFSEYYRELLNDFPIELIETKEKSDGKYEMEVYPSVGNKVIIDICAWDKLESVLDNIDSVEKELNKEMEM